jgi:putative heme iron utilization protein
LLLRSTYHILLDLGWWQMQENIAFEQSSGMERDKIEAARDQLLQLRTVYLAINSAVKAPEMGVSPFIRRADGLYIYTSNLSPHVGELIEQGEATCMLCADEGDSQNIWARNRLKFSVKAVEIARDDRNFDKLCDDFTSAHGPTMDLIRKFTDFHMIRLTPRKGVLVLGFAKAFTVSGANFDISAHISGA